MTSNLWGRLSACAGLLTPPLVVLISAPAQTRLELTVDTIMRGPQLAGYTPSDARWSGDSQRIYFQWKQANDALEAPMDTYEVNRDGSGLRKLASEEIRQLPPLGGDTSKDRHFTVYSQSGDIYLYDNTSGRARQITKTTEAEANPHFLPDGKRIYFTRGNNLFLMSLADGYLEELTDIRAAGAVGDAVGAGPQRAGSELRRVGPFVRRKHGRRSRQGSARQRQRGACVQTGRKDRILDVGRTAGE